MTVTPPPLNPSSPAPAPVQPKTSSLAIASFLIALVPLVPITTIVALVCSSKAKKQIGASNGALKGSGLATAAMIVSLAMAFVIFVVAVLAALAAPAIIKTRKKAEMTRALSNGKQLYLCMLDFESDMGSFPDQSTSEDHKDPAYYDAGTSNRYLAQLIEGDYTTSEMLFTTGEEGYNKADGIISPNAEILKKGENGWAYVLVDDKTDTPVIRGLSTADGGDIPFLIAPLAEPSGKINPKPYDGRWLYIRTDGSARNERYDSGAKTPLDSAAWNEKFQAVVKMPE